MTIKRFTGIYKDVLFVRDSSRALAWAIEEGPDSILAKWVYLLTSAPHQKRITNDLPDYECARYRPGLAIHGYYHHHHAPSARKSCFMIP